MNTQYSRLQILEMIENGEISLEEGLQMIEGANQVEMGAENESPAGVDVQNEPGILPEDAVGEDLTGTPLIVEEPPIEQEPLGGQAPVSPAAISPDKAALESDHAEIFSTIPEGERSKGTFEDAGTGYDKARRGMPEGVEKWRRWWTIPLWIGVGITVLGGLFMLLAYLGSQIGFWFLCWSVFFAFGVVIIALSAQSRTARWLHLRVKQRPGERPANIAISFPLPLRLARWLMRIFGHWIPKTGGASAEDIISALEAVDDTVSFENPVYIEVDDEDGEHVEIYIG
jgi:hypothetical protein